MKYLFTSLLSALAIFAQAQTNVTGGIYSNTSYTLANSPYVVTGDLVIFSSATLTIEPGVEIRVDNGKKIEVRGKIIAHGTAAKPIYVHGNITSHARNFWTGFVFTGSGDFNYCNVSDANTCFNLDAAYQGPYHFRNSRYTHNTQVNYDGGTGGTFFDSCVFTDNVTGTTYFQFGGAVKDCVFDNNEYGATGAENVIRCVFTRHSKVALKPAGYTAGCEMYNNNVGVECGFNSVNKTFVNNKVKNNNVGVRILTYFNGDIQFTGNEICGNADNNIELNHTNDANLANNCWCLADSASIRSKVLDGYRDVSRGLVILQPFSTSCTNALDVKTVDEGQDLIIAPNPLSAGDILHVQLNGNSTKTVTYTVSNVLGQNIPVQLQSEGGGKYALRFHDALQPGVYLLNVHTNTSKLTKKFVVP